MFEVGPIQMVALQFDADAQFEGEILSELSRLQRESTIRLLDLMLLGIDSDTGEPVEISFRDRGASTIVGALMGLGEAEIRERDAAPALPVTEAYGLSIKEIQSLSRTIEPGSVMAFLLFEHVWARDLKRAIAGAGGSVAADGLLTRAAAETIGPDVDEVAEEMARIIRELEPE